VETRGRILDWRFSLAETAMGMVSIATLAVGITTWSLSTFQSKQDASEMKQQFERRIEGVEGEMRVMRSSLDRIAGNVEYIRGRLEPKGQ
jgi:hypothetical protein